MLRGLINERGDIILIPVPKLSEIVGMKHRRLISVLKLCPFSDRFGETSKTLSKETTSKHKARQQLLKMS